MAKYAHGPAADSRVFVGSGGGLGSGAWDYPTAKALHLEYGKLKQRAEAAGAAKRRRVKARAAVSGDGRPTAPPTFVELMASRPGSFPGAVVELEGPRGRMKIELKGVTTVELVTLSWALWDGEGGMIQITPQMRILVALEAVDGRNYAPSINMRSC